MSSRNVNAPGSPRASETGTAQQRTFGFSKDLTALTRRSSFFDSLKDLGKEDGITVMKKSTTGRWNKRYCVLHSHYLSYFASVDDFLSARMKDKGADLKEVKGSYDLWAVEGVQLEGEQLTMILNEEASTARRGEMGTKMIREYKKFLTAFPIANQVAKRLEVARRGLNTPKLELKFSTVSEAQAW